MTKWMSLLAATTALSACATQAPPMPAMAEAAPPVAPVVAPVVAAPQPHAQIGDYGFDAAGMDRSILPGNDFYNYANGTWAKNTPIPADKSNYGAFNVLDDLSKQRTHDILDEAAKDPNSKIGTAYTTFLDTATIEAKGLAPMKPWLDSIGGLNSKAGLADLYARATRMGVGVPFGAGVGQDDKEPEQYSLSLGQAGLGLPDRDYYLSNDPKMVEARNAYVDHIAKMMALAGQPDGAARARAILALETQIAKVSWTRIQNRDTDKTYNKMALADLTRSAKGFDFASYFRGIGTPATSLIVSQPTAVAAIARIVGAAPLGVLKDQLMVRSLDAYADVLPSAFDQENFHFYGTVLSGTPEQQVRWKRAVDFTTGALSDDVSKIYVQRYFPPETKAAADQLVKNIIAAMNRRIDKLDWMSPQTKVEAHAKLAAFTPKIGYPDRWRDYSALQIVKGDALGNEMRANEWAHNYNVGHLGMPMQRWEWGMTPMTINAYANPGMVEIVFPAAILQPPFFDPNADPAVNYGGIGAVIGHEMSHHFDDQGAKYDKTGRLAKWWTDADTAAFQARLDKLGAQYDAYEPLPGKHVQGKLTMGENVADLAGLTVAHDAYIASLNGATPPVIDGTTGDQRFYLGWAQVWRRNYREANLMQRLLTDPHSPSEFRADIVRNMDPWYSAFSPQRGQKLYLAPADRVRIW
ncbi:M13 family metallopeptidase [Sphingomonas sp. ASV193]|uniref:M13 family metallopeptidase n=1 Tax=Sphingomonas sp. ASV193 TaxID=3144405 RepID=UPI0032E877CB